MIRFFSKMRYKLAAENRATKYLRYAIGEILLVVIGILIALNINNWNENRKRQIVKHEYTASLIADLKRDTAEFHNYLDYNRLQEAMLDSLKDALNTPTLKVEDLRNVYFVVNLDLLKSFTNGTFVALRNSGNLDLYPASIRSELIKLNGTQEEYLNWAATNSQMYYETLNLFMHVAPYQGNKIRSSLLPDHLIQQAWENVDANRYITDFHALTSQKRFMLALYTNYYTHLLRETNHILDRMEKTNDDAPLP